MLPQVMLLLGVRSKGSNYPPARSDITGLRSSATGAGECHPGGWALTSMGSAQGLFEYLLFARTSLYGFPGLCSSIQSIKQK